MKNKSLYSLKIKILIFFISVSCIAFGGKHLYLAYTDPVATEINITNFEIKKPNTKWLKITNGFYDVDKTIYKKSSNFISTLYIPYVSKPDGKIHLFIETKDPRHIDFFSHAIAMLSEIDKSKNEKIVKRLKARNKARKFFSENKEWFNSINVEGILRYDIERRSGIEEKIVALSSRLAPNYAVLKLNEKPASLVASLLMIFFGIGILVFVVYSERKMEKNVPYT